MFKNKHFKNVPNSIRNSKFLPSNISNNSSSSSSIKSVRSSNKSINIPSNFFRLSNISTFGFIGKPVCSAFDFSQSLLATATESGDIYIFGKQNVEALLTVEKKIFVKHMSFVKGVYLVIVDSSNILTVYSLYSQKIIDTAFTPTKITCIETDPSIDWVLLGLEDGTIMIYDVDRNTMTENKIENFQKTKYFPSKKISPIVSLQWNPRDLGTILISYDSVTIIYSFIDRSIKQDFIYSLPPGAPGGELSKNQCVERFPKVIQSVYNPNSLNILTVHQDNSLVFWDANTGQLIQARTCFEIDIHVPQPRSTPLNHVPAVPQISKVLWICREDPEYTSLLVYMKPINNFYGKPTNSEQSFMILDLDHTPLYSISSYENMSIYYANQQNQKILPLDHDRLIVDILPLPRASPYFHGCHDPEIVMLTFDDGEIETMLYPSGLFTQRASLFPQSFCWVRPTVSNVSAISIPQKLWLGMTTALQNNKSECILHGGFPKKKNVRATEYTPAILTGHSNGSVRIWDASKNDTSIFEVNCRSILNLSADVSINQISFSPDTLELTVSMDTGDVLLLKFQNNEYFNDHNELNNPLNYQKFSLSGNKNSLVDVRFRSPPNIPIGFMPIVALHAQKGKTSAIKNSDVGFVALAYLTGSLIIIDRRSPKIIFLDNIRKFVSKSSSCITAIDFSIMEYGEDGYSSIMLLCGTDGGSLLIFKILPDRTSGHHITFVEEIKSNHLDPIKYIGTFSSTGLHCTATLHKMNELGKGIAIQGYVCTVGEREVRLLCVGKSKNCHEQFKGQIAVSRLCSIPYFDSNNNKRFSTVLVLLFYSGDVKVLSVPNLDDIRTFILPCTISAKYISSSSIMKNGDILLRCSQTQCNVYTIINELATGITKQRSIVSNDQVIKDVLYNPSARIPFRPQVNSLQWVRGTVYTSAEQLDQILGGPRRTPSKNKESIMALGSLTLTKGADEKRVKPSDFKTNAQLKHSARHPTYNAMRNASRALESTWYDIEGGINEYATALGQSMSDTMEDTSKDIMKDFVGI
ncbi:hypothetical protein TBLA_0F00440 [Henningerozyma blattae CBS 6284]|uniref:Lethal giant larvae (Lgl)-like C-terminal domain-containing protein n=1 Tax=Henningerozyma blattae (strain ATCC 34711 / CBS 6284 / DSM 70876 / NBRC 10599 / NRRL Y-10934 / UCD 77-7) TaxID=1071380 RepID=I2H5D6_HENB6|nr:hypothetical protein TBLA_0F00440 [Tetrapisispora blattae CBS 6284]CCH61588.1 hypothetical protein TBLA_0F00440 [Tetrapisispora blattae CBS 6284]